MTSIFRTRKIHYLFRTPVSIEPCLLSELAGISELMLVKKTMKPRATVKKKIIFSLIKAGMATDESKTKKQNRFDEIINVKVRFSLHIEGICYDTFGSRIVNIL